MAEWIVKTEPSVYSIDDLARDGRTAWTGVRNFVARNHMKAMKPGDRLIVYHSNAKPPGAAGTATVSKAAFPDASQFDRKDDHFEPRATPEKPYWYNVEVAFGARFARLVPLEELQADAKLQGMLLTSGKASRLSVQPLSKAHFDRIVQLGGKA